jgi:hypothetical protein
MKPPIKGEAKGLMNIAIAKIVITIPRSLLLYRYDGKRTSWEKAAEESREHNGLVVLGDRNGYREYAGRLVAHRISDVD